VGEDMRDDAEAVDADEPHEPTQRAIDVAASSSASIGDQNTRTPNRITAANGASYLRT